MAEVIIIPIPSQKLHQQGLAHHKTVTFYPKVQVKRIPPRSKLSDILTDLWYAEEDIKIFAEEKYREFSIPVKVTKSSEAFEEFNYTI